jgi:methyl-accepting chemotaxis protein
MSRIKFGMLWKSLMLVAIVAFGVGSTVLVIGNSAETRTANDSAALMGEKKLEGDLWAFKQMVSRDYGALRKEGRDLIDAQGVKLDGRYEVVDELLANMGIVSTIFVRDGNDFRRVLTSIKDDKGERIIGTMLGEKSAAYPSMMAGKRYLGQAKILNRPFLAGYQPLFDDSGAEVIGLLFVGIELTWLRAEIKASLARNMLLMGVGALLAELVFMLIGGFIINSILARPLRNTVFMLKNISDGDGDLSGRLAVRSRDEIGDLAGYFNKTLDKVSSLVVSIRKQTETLANVGHVLSANMTETTGSIARISSGIQEVSRQTLDQAASVTQTHSTMEQITAHIERVNGHIDTQAASVTQSSSAIEEMLASISSVTRALAKNSENADELASASEQGHNDLNQVSESIRQIAKESASLIEISSVIGDIASQTNLLSMNAAIEAAHAGESGKGFAVVADEIRRLAETSERQAKTVSSVLAKIKASVDSVALSADQVLVKFESINSMIKTVSERESAIRRAMEEQSAGSKEVLKAISALNEVTVQVKAGSGEMLSGSREIIKESGNLNTITETVRGSMDEMTDGVRGITLAIDKVSSISHENKASIDALIAEVSKFKV